MNGPTAAMVVHKPSHHRSTRNHVHVSRRAFAFIWLAVVALHGLCLLYFATVAKFYVVTTPGSGLAIRFAFFKIGLPAEHYHLFAVIHGIFAGYHGLQISSMLAFSVLRRWWSFGFWQEFARHLRRAAVRRQQAPDVDRGTVNAIARVKTMFFRVLRTVFGRNGVLGVEGRHFDMVLIAREVLETSLQSSQAYTMSVHVPRPWLNRLYVALIVINCSMTPLLNEVFATNRLLRRSLLLACDATLDLFSSVIVQLLLIVAYLRDYDPSSFGFPASLWLNDHWFVNATNELQLLVVSSWGDLASRITFSFAFISSLENIKSLVRVRSNPLRTAVHPSLGPDNSAVGHASPHGNPDHASSSVSTATLHLEPLWRRRAERIVHFSFGAWAIAVLGMHLHAESVPRPSQCAITVQPWLVAKPTCAMILLDCHRQGVVGLKTEVAPQWTAFEAVYVVRLVVRHCPRLQIPPALQRFGSVGVLKLYNTTIDDWSKEAALSQLHHPLITTLMLVRVLLPNGTLPAGVTSPGFPKGLINIQVCRSNLSTLPADLDTSWSRRGNLLLEGSLFSSVPPVVKRLQPQQLSFAFNRFTTFPFDVVTWPGLRIFNVGGNPITSLLDETTNNMTSSLVLLILTDTNVTLLPRWIDRLLTLKDPRWGVNAGRTPLCRNAARIHNGELTAFPGTETVPPASLSFTMAVTAPRVTPLATMTVCAPFITLFYPLANEDIANGM